MWIKNLEKIIILLSLVFSVCFFANLQAFAQEITIANFQTIPSQIHVGDSFRINATIVNNSPYVIDFNGGCQSPLSATFDKNVLVDQAMSCFAIYSIVLNPGQNITVVGPSSSYSYTTTSSGITNANVTFAYQTSNKTENAVSRIFVFDIPEGTTIPEFPSLAGAIFVTSILSVIVIVSKTRNLF